LDASGKVVFTNRYLSNSFSLNLSEIAPGMYWIILESGQEKQIQKIIVH